MCFGVGIKVLFVDLRKAPGSVLVVHFVHPTASDFVAVTQHGNPSRMFAS